MDNEKKYLIIILFVLAFATRLLFFLYEININNITKNKEFYVNDAKEYQELALSISNGDFIEEWYPPFLDISLRTGTLRTPGYPLFLSFIYSIFGMNNHFAAIVIQIFLSSLTVIFTYKLCMELLNDQTISFLAGLLVAFDFYSIILSNLLLTETLATFFIVIGILFLIKSLKNKKNYYTIVSSSLLAVATYVRPITLYLPFFMLPVFMYAHWKNKNKMLLNGFVFLIIFFGICGIWIYRNYKETNVPMFSSIQGINIYYYRAAGVIALENGGSIVNAFRVGDTFDNAQKELTQNVKNLWFNKKFNFEQKMITLEKMGTDIILNHPLYYIELALIGAIRMILAVPRRCDIESLFHSSQFTAIWMILCLQFIVIFVGYIEGIIISLKRNKYLLLITLLTIAFYFIIVSSGPEADGRFRVPWMPFVAILSSYGLKHIWSKIHLSKINFKG